MVIAVIFAALLASGVLMVPVLEHYALSGILLTGAYAAFRSVVSTAKANRASVLDVIRFVLDPHSHMRPRPGWGEQLRKANFEASIGYWSGRIDPDGNMYAFLHSGAPLNDCRYSNATLDSLLDQARQVTDVDSRRGIYQKAWTIGTQDLPIIYLWTWTNMVGMSAKIQGFAPISRRSDSSARIATRALTTTRRPAITG